MDKSMNDPEIAASELKSARQERGYLESESGQERYSVIRDGSTVKSGLDFTDAQDLRDSLLEHAPDVDCQIVNDHVCPCPCTGPGRDGEGTHHGELTLIQFRDREIEVCANHLDGYLRSEDYILDEGQESSYPKRHGGEI